jgi:hypothetical protein
VTSTSEQTKDQPDGGRGIVSEASAEAAKRVLVPLAASAAAAAAAYVAKRAPEFLERNVMPKLQDSQLLDRLRELVERAQEALLDAVLDGGSTGSDDEPEAEGDEEPEASSTDEPDEQRALETGDSEDGTDSSSDEDERKKRAERRAARRAQTSS